MIGPAKCSTCAWWRQGGGSDALATRDPAASPQHGTCESGPPTVMMWGSVPRGYYPVTHADRRCSLWESVPGDNDDDDDEDDPDGPDGGEELSAGEVVAFRSAA